MRFKYTTKSAAILKSEVLSEAGSRKEIKTNAEIGGMYNALEIDTNIVH